MEDAVQELERALRSRRRRRLRTWGGLALGVAILIAVVWGIGRATEPPPQSIYTTSTLERRTVAEKVTATGSAKPVTEVQVGAQVSGRLAKIHVDFNSQVRKGDLLAEIDPSLFSAEVSQGQAARAAAGAAVSTAKAQLGTARLDLRRATELQKRGVASQANVDKAQGAYDVAAAALKSAEAQVSEANARLTRATTTLGYAKIYSPVEGVVVNRAVEPGQTVAANFSAPVLFVIAKDLRAMQVLADIDEADVGKLKEQMTAEVEVDAFPGEPFAGLVSQVRYSPNEDQGVVTYSAVIDVDNPDLKLRPGMTANVTIKTAVAEDALAVRNAALRFQPAPPKKDSKGSGPPQAQELKKRGDESPLLAGQGRVYLLKGAPPDESAEQAVLELGITDGMWTVVEGGPVEVGTEVVTRQREADERGFRFF